MTKIIRDEGFMGNTFTTCLGIDWGIRRCNIHGCYETTLGAIVRDTENNVTYGLCEAHYQMIGSQEQGMFISLDFTPVEEARILDRIEANTHAHYAGEWLANV